MTSISSSSSHNNSNNTVAPVTMDLKSGQSLFSCIYPVVAFDVVLWPARNKRLLINQLASITDFYQLPIATTYCEIIRSCIVGLVDATGTTDHAKWAVFFFLKLSPLLRELGSHYHSTTRSQAPSGTTNQISNLKDQALVVYAQDLKHAIERLLCYKPLIDLADFKCNCDFLDCLVQELCKPLPAQILTTHLYPLAQQRKELRATSQVASFVASANLHAPGLFRMLQAEPALLTILIDVSDPVQRSKDDTKDTNNDKFVRVLCQLVQGKSFELSLAAAAATGRLHELSRRLIDIHESSASSNPLLFDITFLILAHIGHHYGLEALDSDGSDTVAESSHFVRWFSRCYHYDTMISCPKLMLSLFAGTDQSNNQERVDLLIEQLLALVSDSKATLSLVPGKLDSWHDISTYIPLAFSHLLEAWQINQLDESIIRVIVERVKARACCLALIVAAWLRAHIRTLGYDERHKPLLLMQELARSSSSARNSVSNSSSDTSIVATESISLETEKSSEVESESQRERASLMSHLIKKMQLELTEASSSLPSSSSSPSQSIPNAQASAAQSNSTTTAQSSALATKSDSRNKSKTSSSSENQAINRRLYNVNTPARDLLDAQLMPSFERGWLDTRAVHHVNILLRHVCSPEWFVDALVERVLSHDSPSDLAQALDLALGVMHLDICACAHALVTHTVVKYLACQGHSTAMMQPRANALARLTVVALTCAQHETRAQIQVASCDTKAVVVQHEPMDVDHHTPGSSHSMGSQNLSSAQTSVDNSAGVGNLATQSIEWEAKLHAAIRQLIGLLKTILEGPRMSQRTLFPVCFIQQMLECEQRADVSVLRRYVGPDMIDAASKIIASNFANRSVNAQNGHVAGHQLEATQAA